LTLTHAQAIIRALRCRHSEPRVCRVACGPARRPGTTADAAPLLTLTGPGGVGSWATYTFAHRRWGAGATASYPAVTNDAGAVLRVIAGTLIATTEEDGAAVLRGANLTQPSAEESIAANVETTLESGDCLQHPVRITDAVRNPGASDVDVFEAATWDRPDPVGDTPVATHPFGDDAGLGT
jgi:hypothetical protein